MRNYIALGFCMIAAGVVATGCAPTQLGDNYGTAYYSMMEGQILNPTAGQNQDPVTGLDGQAAAIAIERYRNSFEQPDADLGNSLVSSGVRTK